MEINNLYNLTSSFGGWRRCVLFADPLGIGASVAPCQPQNPGVILQGLFISTALIEEILRAQTAKLRRGTKAAGLVVAIIEGEPDGEQLIYWVPLISRKSQARAWLQ